jgi:hypothetical protein
MAKVFRRLPRLLLLARAKVRLQAVRIDAYGIHLQKSAQKSQEVLKEPEPEAPGERRTLWLMRHPSNAYEPNPPAKANVRCARSSVEHFPVTINSLMNRIIKSRFS